MGSPQERAFEVVVLAASFRDARGRPWIVENFPPSVVDLFDAVLAQPDWLTAAGDLTQAGLIVARVLEEDSELAACYQADVDAGHLGFGAGEDEEMDAAVRSITDTLAPPMMPMDTDIFLSESAGPEAQPPPTTEGGAEAPEDVETVRTWLNAALDRPSHELAVGVQAVLSIFFGERDPGSTASVMSFVAIPHDADEVVLDVAVASSDFRIAEPVQALTLRRDGTSAAPADFGIVPLRAGLARLTVVVTVGANFVQRIDITYDVGGTADDLVRERGRPLTAAAVLGPRSASIHITHEDDAYEVFAPAAFPDRPNAAPIRLQATALDLAPRIAGVRKALLDAVRKDPAALEMTIAPEHTDQLLAKLAFAGFRLYQAVFEDGGDPDLIRIGAWLRGLAAQDDVTTVQLVTDGFPVPWPLMYLADSWEPDALSWDGFLGMQCVIEQVPFAQLTAPPDTTIASQPEVAVRALLNESIDAEMPSRPITAQREYWRGRGVGLVEGTTRADVESALTSDAASDVLYFFCHAESDDDDPDASELIMTGKDIITLGEIRAIAQVKVPFAGHPLVFLNACESGELSPLFYSGFVPYFLNRGARGVIGTECRVPGLFASEWAKAFFDGLFSGEALGRVVLDVRRRFLAEHNNPLGLLYVVHCDADTVVAPALT